MKLMIVFIALILPTIVQASTEIVEEVTYEDLVNQLSAQQRPVTQTSVSPFDSVKLHAGIGLINSFSTFRIDNKNSSRYQNGMQLSVGVDLFSVNWIAEAAWRNFGLTRHGAEEHYLREMDLKVAYHNVLQGPWSYRLESGLAHRSLRLTDSSREITIDETTPGILLGAGLVLQMSPAVSLNFDSGARSPVIGQSADKGSLDFALAVKISI